MCKHIYIEIDIDYIFKFNDIGSNFKAFTGLKWHNFLRKNILLLFLCLYNRCALLLIGNR